MRMQRTRGQVALALLAGAVAAVVVVCEVSGRRQAGGAEVLEEREGYDRDEPREDPLGGFAPRGMGKVSYAASLGQRPDMEHLGFYDTKKDPWLKADGKGSYKFWSDDYNWKQGDGTAWSGPSQDEDEEKALDEEEEPEDLPDRDNQKNGWQQAEFSRWINKQAEFSRWINKQVN
ncbi:hypothetical protein T484DRAFT_1778517 [Baffinella frigidus]|nr:hypothetical protein T484DRAFT_1778517 [Cryptophyta sp. CCMP2293]